METKFVLKAIALGFDNFTIKSNLNEPSNQIHLLLFCLPNLPKIIISIHFVFHQCVIPKKSIKQSDNHIAFILIFSTKGGEIMIQNIIFDEHVRQREIFESLML